MLLTVVVVEQISFLKTYDFYKYITTMMLTVYYLEFSIFTSILSYTIHIHIYLYNIQSEDNLFNWHFLREKSFKGTFPNIA